MTRKCVLVILLLGLMTLVITGCSASSSIPVSPAASNTPPETKVEAVSLKIGSLPRIFDMIAFAGQQDGIFKKHDLNVEVVTFRSDVEMTNALLVGELDGVIQGIYAAANMNKDKVNVKLIGHNFMPRMFELLVSSGSGITSPSQIKGKEVAISTGTIMEYALDEMLKSQGMTGKDVIYVNVPSIPLRVEMLNQGKLPAAVLTSPSSDLALATGNKLIIDDAKQPLSGPGLIFTINALNAKSDGIARFLQAWQETVAAVNANPQKYHGLLVTVAKVPEPVTASLKVPVFPELRLPAQTELEPIMTWMISKGFITQPIPYDKIVETKYLK